MSGVLQIHERLPTIFAVKVTSQKVFNAILKLGDSSETYYITWQGLGKPLYSKKFLWKKDTKKMYLIFRQSGSLGCRCYFLSYSPILYTQKKLLTPERLLKVLQFSQPQK